MTKPIYAIYGASGCGRSLMPVARQQLQRDGLTAELYFIDDRFDQPTVWNGHPAVNYATFQQLQASSKHVVIAIANSRIREKIALQLQQDEIKMWSICADNVVLMDEVDLGEGSALSPFVTVTSNIRIGKCFHANLYSYVEHDCLIGDYVTFAPGVKCNGNIHIHDHAYIGAGAVIKQGTPNQPLVIGQGAVIGMGAVVTKSVPAGVTVVGNPARIMQKK
ncbi:MULTISPECIES: acetyltransferase [Acinetobacter]|jgi:sugar O-acyltransferase (sialic acid O-acetyltransferase NeuD family)|uniref:acetyltransferase n=1 Tax=Acinetobacter TaxID=469 RepID=UPI000579E4DD|nr:MULTISPECIES: acetyltransferase [Acinetobacter]MDA3502669.1 acetyltransferase [Acinetobacter sp. AOR34_HL]MDU2407884.1 acetyltransferase [Acinetobacter junii]MDU6055901.1 acetyltransferase [Acinetobacter junii]MEB8382665.1 acetyltransferase [Acinetobacter junii]RTE45805.1 acetyltransferase [Acinetobacter junii]